MECCLLRAYGITRKKIRRVALQRSDSLRGAFMAQFFVFNVDQVVWIDESGSDGRDQSQKNAYALQGQVPVVHWFLSRGTRTNAITAICSSGLVSLELTTSKINQEVFFDYVRRSLIPNLMPLMESIPSVHHVSEVLDLFHQGRILMLFLPPYNLDLNPIEEAFSYVSWYLRRHDDSLQTIPNPLNVIRSAFYSITTDHC